MREKRIEHVFLVRLWREGQAGNTPWRGCVDHVRTGERRYFTALGELSRYISGQIDANQEAGGRQ